MLSVELTEEEWQQVISIIASSNPLLMKIAHQVRRQSNSGDKPIIDTAPPKEKRQ